MIRVTSFFSLPSGPLFFMIDIHLPRMSVQISFPFWSGSPPHLLTSIQIDPPPLLHVYSGKGHGFPKTNIITPFFPRLSTGYPACSPFFLVRNLSLTPRGDYGSLLPSFDLLSICTPLGDVLYRGSPFFLPPTETLSPFPRFTALNSWTLPSRSKSCLPFSLAEITIAISFLEMAIVSRSSFFPCLRLLFLFSLQYLTLCRSAMIFSGSMDSVGTPSLLGRSPNFLLLIGRLLSLFGVTSLCCP